MKDSDTSTQTPFDILKNAQSCMQDCFQFI